MYPIYMCPATAHKAWGTRHPILKYLEEEMAEQDGPLHMYVPGDIIIGGLFPVHLQTNRTTMPGNAHCMRYDVQMFLRSQVMTFAIQEINQRTPKVLPNLTIGYDIYDTCGDVTFAIRATFGLLKDKFNSCFQPGDSNSTVPEPHAKVVIGERYSEVSVAVARILTLSSVAQKILPGDFSVDESKAHDKLEELMGLLRNSTAEAIILFTKGANVDVIMKAAIQNNLSRIWIGSDSWSTSTRIAEIKGIYKVGQVFGFISKRNEVPGFKDYVTSMFQGTTNPFLEQYLSYYPRCNSSEKNSKNNCSLTKSQHGSKQCLDPRCLVNYIDQDESYNIYVAVKVIAEGLRQLLKCDSEKCGRNATFTALELFQEIKKVNFTVDTTHIFFDDNGDPSIGYDIVNWDMTESKVDIKTIGEYWPSGKIKLPDDLISKMCNVTETTMNCSKSCALGHELRKPENGCCKKCVPCHETSFSPGKGVKCEPCRNWEYPSPEKDKCLNKTLDFLKWWDPFAIVLSFFEIVGIVITILVTVLFAVHRNTPIVKAVGGYLSFLELFSLLACFCITFTFTAKPSTASCVAGLPLFGILFTLCISCILANLLQILVCFRFDQRKSAWLKRLNRPVAVVAVIFCAQLILCVLWLYYRPPIPKEVYHAKTILLQCEKGSKEFFGVMLGYNALLAFACFLFAFHGKLLPDLYKNASFITISMLLYLVIWIVFIPIYISMVGKYTRAIEAAAVLVSNYSILCCHLAPKCYIMLFRKEINSEQAITEYIRKHCEQKGIAVVKS
ncbi:G-protein coupled receptor family C group 6 member A-like isoform X2 [Myripristis murdjan]|uniref:G-protein coupled receptor family C group 6 member A-like isoform X2 n=1 Tax=Myripristis murdjan TaxID=586833 RepID=UPI001176243F|nr:G-protein coupled receptor family C group 6 member A-like isoform X2 [Myripristis murdjan]